MVAWRSKSDMVEDEKVEIKTVSDAWHQVLSPSPYCAAFYNADVRTDICIRGAGPVGQTLALLLARARIRVALSAGQAARQGDIRSYALNAASKQLLTELRAWPEQACPVAHMQVFGDAASQIRFDASVEPLAWIVDAADLQERLQMALSYAPDISLMADLQEVQAELTVICEGRASHTRQATGAAYEQFAYGQHAVAAHVVCELPHQHTAWQWMSAEQVCALLPRGASAAGNSVALVWSVSSERAQALSLLPPQVFADELTQATQGKLGKLSLHGERSAWPLMLSQATQWSGCASLGAWTLAGDAAHSVHPLAGQGLNLGLGDAAELAKLLVSKPYFRAYGDAKLLRAYERARKSEAALLRAATDGLQRVFASADPRLQNLRNWGMQSLHGIAPLKAWVMQQASGLR
jgi:2-polyprenyl-6-methoxyphenol hydroxylase-like FAD-dependent oxidoreductase